MRPKGLTLALLPPEFGLGGPFSRLNAEAVPDDAPLGFPTSGAALAVWGRKPKGRAAFTRGGARDLFGDAILSALTMSSSVLDWDGKSRCTCEVEELRGNPEEARGRGLLLCKGDGDCGERPWMASESVEADEGLMFVLVSD